MFSDYSDKIATTRSIPSTADVNARFAEIVAQNPDAGLSSEEANRRFAEIMAASALTDYEIAAGSMDPVVRAEHEARLFSDDGQPQLADGWLAHIVSKPQQGEFREPKAAERLKGAEVHQTYVHEVAMYADRMPDIRALAMKNGKPSFRQEDYARGA